MSAPGKKLAPPHRPGDQGRATRGCQGERLALPAGKGERLFHGIDREGAAEPEKSAATRARVGRLEHLSGCAIATPTPNHDQKGAPNAASVGSLRMHASAADVAACWPGRPYPLGATP